MDKLTRRSLLRALATGALSTAGTVVLARASFAAATDAPVTGAAADVQARAAGLEKFDLGAAGEAHAQFLNVGVPGLGFGNGGFRNGGFFNGPFRNGGFLNGGGFRNGGFRNGGFRNGGFRNGGFRNGGFRNW